MVFSEGILLFLKEGRLATGGTNTTLIDADVDWPINIWAGVPVKIRKGTTEYTREVISNTATQLTFAALPGAIVVAAGDAYFFPPSASTLLSLLTNIYNLVNAMLVDTETGGTITTTGAVQDVYVNNAPAGIFEPRRVKIDFTNQTAAETVVVSVYYRIRPGGALVLQDTVTFIGVQVPALRVIDMDENRYGVQVTLQRTAGGALDYDWEVVSRE